MIVQAASYSKHIATMQGCTTKPVPITRPDGRYVEKISPTLPKPPCVEYHELHLQLDSQSAHATYPQGNETIRPDAPSMSTAPSDGR